MSERPSGFCAPEVAVERSRPPDRVVGRVRDELEQLAADDERAATIHVDPAHRAAVLAVEVAGERVLRLVVVLVGVEQPVVDRRHARSVAILDMTVKFVRRRGDQAVPGRGTRRAGTEQPTERGAQLTVRPVEAVEHLHSPDEPVEVVLEGETDRTEHLQAVLRRQRPGRAGERLRGHGGALGIGPPTLVDHRRRGLACDVDVGQSVLHRLERADRLTELRTHLRVLRRGREHGVGGPEQLVRQRTPTRGRHRGSVDIAVDLGVGASRPRRARVPDPARGRCPSPVPMPARRRRW